MLEEFSKAIRAAVVAGAGTFVGERVYADLAPKGAKMPYIIINVASASTPNRMSIREGRVTFNIQAMVNALESGDAMASRIHDAVFDHLRDLELTLESPWVFHRLEHLTTYRRIEITDTQRFAYAGGLYLLEADQA